ncbi:MRL1 [[Candida] subhashii]|uniref:MRL1 n=1 Tax=[Candida] subhashii TaxID=561895 RepID=A0A8J5QGG7_9ASCO|nr:MRL1 [[Candida] subhashii]KAG7660746.1 MRL1 [[Candida] subhashii]
MNFTLRQSAKIILRKVTILFLILILLVATITVIESKQNDTLYEAGSHILDSISHISFEAPREETNPQQQQQQQQEQPEHEHEEHKEEAELDPCTVIHPVSKGFIDLRGLSSISNEGKPLPWASRGYDSGNNYTIGICSNPFKKSHDGHNNEIKDGVEANKIGAFYIDNETNKYVSMGEFSTTPKFRGRKLTLTYENGAYCNALDSKSGQRLRKSTILTFTCDREMMAKAQVSFVGSSNDCSYFFEVRSHHACPTAGKENTTGAVWIFLLIVLAAIMVYFSGGFLYKQMKKIKSNPTKGKH